MCGVAGSYGRVQLDAPTRELMLAALHHRGPDGRGEKVWDDAALLHTRLRIIDLSASGDQPMANEDGSVWTVFNGEIYNHRALRTDLEARGHRFRGHSDTEVLPHLYEEYGDGMFERLRGMFTVAILDRREPRLLLGRDRFGIKPLFYAHGDGFLAFASEIAILRLVPGVDLTPDRQAIADFAALLFVPAPLTIHRGIRALSPGELLDCRPTGTGDVRVDVRPFHTFSIEPDPELTVDDAVDEAERLIEQAVVRQLESDVPLGSLLSGGIDSSLVSLFAQRRVPGDLLTFNVRPPDAEYDETWAAEAVAAAIGSRHRTLEMERRGASWDDITDLLRHAGQPFADTSLFAVDAISRAMRRHVTVALSGDGGDEGFGGYNAYWQITTIDRLRQAPPVLWHTAARMVAPLARLGFVRPTLGERARDIAGADDAAIVQTIFSWVREREHRQLLADADGVESPRRLFEPRWRYSLGPGTSRLERLSAHAVEANVRLVLANDYLAKVDTGSMRHSLEVRVPMLDEDLIAFGLTLPHELRVKGRTGKRILRAVAARNLPPAVAVRAKQGFEVPVDRWVDPTFTTRVRETLLDRSSPVGDHLDRRAYEPWVAAFGNGGIAAGVSRDGLYQRVMMLLSLDLALRDLRQRR
ncbi:MAG TPA: asparagine synthase (glutamine-hydrolyzing) [Gaiellaceae bacterium]